MEAEDSGFHDWEVLSEPFMGDVAESQESCEFVEGLIQNNYFSLDSPNKNVVSDESSIDSSDDKRVTEFEGKYDVGFVRNDQNGKFQEGFDAVEHMVTENDQNGVFLEGSNEVEHLVTENDQNRGFEAGFNGVEHIVSENDKNLEKVSDDSSGIGSGEMTFEGVPGSGELGMKENEISGGENSEREATEEKGETEVSKVEEEKKKSGIVWWKLPVEFLRYCVFKGPVWTVSVAAAFVGFVVLGNRLHKMKKKNRALAPTITMDDKKISQFMSRAARLNEAFSVVKRRPIIRPSLPASGVSPWPLVSLR